MQLFLSDLAYNNLVEKARYTGHVRREKAFGLNKYMIGLLATNGSPEQWHDTRPENIKAQDIPGLEAGMLPVWDDGEYRSVRVLSISPTIEPIIGSHFGMVKRHPTMGWLSFKPSSLMSQFWEAVGIGWLTPEHEPTPPAYKTNRPWHPQEYIKF